MQTRTMPPSKNYRGPGDYYQSNLNYQSSFNRNKNNVNWSNDDSNLYEFPRRSREHMNNIRYYDDDVPPTMKRRKVSSSSWKDCGRYYPQSNVVFDNAPSTSDSPYVPSKPSDSYYGAGCKRDRSAIEDDLVFMSKDEIERLSPSRKDGIDSLRETYLRYSYCGFLQSLGMKLELPQTTIGTAMVLCHRFFLRRSHACHDRFLIATAAIFLGAKSEETPRPLNNVLRASCEICHQQGLQFFSYLLPVDWFEQYRERVLEAEQMILTTLDFELNVQHPYASVTSVLSKLGLSETALTSLALSVVSEGLIKALELCVTVLANIAWLFEDVLVGKPLINVLWCIKWVSIQGRCLRQIRVMETPGKLDAFPISEIIGCRICRCDLVCRMVLGANESRL
ncbi:hypothetical protein Sjap_006596 [Stephania japonica]|uniref:Cyclin-like domain-containing protein n=1 Tax=Stephania japonica TaxID=461633 RepID=A0AAP0PJ25_9MAGN